MRPTVSVVLAVYNATWCVARALDSVLAQTVAPLEVLVCDDGSTDGTPDFVESRYGAPVRVIRLPYTNAAATRRVGLERAEGQWLAFLDADDWWAPNKLERQLDAIAANPGLRFVTSDGPFVGEEGVLRPSWLSDYFSPVRDVTGDLYPLLLRRCFVLTSSVMIEREAYRATGGIDPAIECSHDYDLWLRVLARHPGAVIAEPLISYWSSAGSLSRKFETRHREDLGILRRAARGELRDDPACRALARTRVSGLAFDVAVMCLRDGRVAEARELLAEAAQAGPPSRRLLATLGRLAPAPLVGLLGRQGWLKRAVAGARTRPGTIPGGGRAA